MNERLLLEMTTSLGYRLAMAGAETYRVEESITMVLRSYGLEGEVFGIPNCLTVSIITSDGRPMTRMRRIGTHGNDLDAVERYNSLSRRLCSEQPAPETAMEWLEETRANLRLAREAGLRVGAYFYSTAVNPAEALEEAAAALKTLDGFPLDLPVYIDMEYSGDYPYGRSDALTPGERADVIETFCGAIRQAGYEAGLYASEGYARFDLDTEAVKYLPFWMASYTVENRLPAHIRTYSVWQQTDSTYAGGVDGAFDLNIILPS